MPRLMQYSQQMGMSASLTEDLVELVGVVFEHHRDETYRLGPIQVRGTRRNAWFVPRGV